MKKKRAVRKPHHFVPKKPARNWALVVIDQEPIRKKAASECGKAMSRLEKAKSEWKQFDREDRPAYSRWMSATFGALLTKIRDTEALVRDKEMLVADVETEYMFGGRGGYAAAYQRVMKDREFPPNDSDPFGGPPPDPDHGPFEDEEETEDDLIEQEMLFEEFVRAFLGINPDRMSDAKYEKMFKDFQENVLGKKKAEAPPPPPPRGSASQHAPPAAAKPEAVRIKEAYRELVRRLHPDLRADKDEEVSHFWHEVQEAYGQGNLERLEMLLALTDLQSNTAGDHISLFQMRSVLSELRKAFRALQKSLGDAKKDPAWNFARLSNRQTMQARIQRQLNEELSVHETHLEGLEQRIAQWKAAATRPKKPKTPPAPFKPAPPPPTQSTVRKKAPPPRNFYPRYEQTGFGF